MNRDIHNSHSGINAVIISRHSNRRSYKSISPKQRKKFIKKIFNNDVDDFNKFAALIRNIKSRKNAKILVDFYFYKNGVDPESKEALEFTNTVYDIYELNRA